MSFSKNFINEITRNVHTTVQAELRKSDANQMAQRIARDVLAYQAEQKKPQLPDYAVADIEAGEFTVAELFSIKAVPGAPADYNLTEFTEAQKGNLNQLAS